MPNYLLKLNKWDLETEVEAASLKEAKAVYMSDLGINGTSVDTWATQVNLSAQVEEEDDEVDEVLRQELVQEAMAMGIENPLHMTIEELQIAVAPEIEDEDEDEKEED